MLRLHYGNDKRNPIRSLDLAQTAPGAIRLLAGGFAPGAGELNELWSGNSVRFDGQKKLRDSRQNSKLAITYVLKTGGSQAALGYFQRQVNRFFLEARQYQVKYKQGHTVWLEYRWSDGLSSFPTPTFGQLSGYYEIYSAKTPKWPDSLHDRWDGLLQGLIDGIQIELTASPAPEGLEQQAAQAGGTIALHSKGVQISSGASSKLHWPSYSITGLTQNFTVTMWATLSAAPSGNMTFFGYYVDANNQMSVVYNTSATRWQISKTVGGVTVSANSSSDTIANGDDVHLCLVQDGTTLRLYVNGVSAASVTATNSMTDSGLISFGCPATGTVDGINVILDGCRIMPDDISSAEAATLYEVELPIKQDGGQVGAPPYFWTKDGDNVLDNVDDTNRDNWGIIGGVSGDLEADTRIGVVWTSAYARDIWIGMKSQDSTFTPSSYLWNELTGLTNTADSSFSGGSYTSGSFATQGAQLSAVKTGLTSTLLYGRYQVLTLVGSTNSTNVRYWWKFGAASTNDDAHNIGDDVSYSIDLTSGFQLLSLGDAFIESSRYTAPTGYEISAYLELVDDISDVISWTARGDFIFLLPWPYARIVDTQSSWSGATDPYSLSIEGTRAYTTDTGADFAYIGDPIRPHPGKYNYLFLMQVENALNEFQPADTATISVWVTPRFTLPGGMVA